VDHKSTFLKSLTSFSGKRQKIAIITIVSIVVISYGLFFYLQNNTESNIRNTLFEQQKQRQIESTRIISQHIGSDLSLVMSMLDGLANSLYLQQGDLYGDQTKKLLEEKYNQYNTVINRLFILDKNDIVTNSLAPQGAETFLGQDFSLRDWIKETRATLKPVFSDGFERQGIYRIFITYPIIERATGEYIGTIATSIPTVAFFAHYGNIYDVKSQYLAVLDSNSTQLIHPVESFVGTPFFGNYTQETTGHNDILNNLISTVMAGKPSFAVYEFKNGERLNTGYPIFVQGTPRYFAFVITPTSTIYSQINSIISLERLEMFSLLAGTTAAVIVLILFLMKWSSSLDNEVKRRTIELDESNQRLKLVSLDLKKANDSLVESNRQLALANQQLEIQDKAQKEFINVAAHELRTPIQPILGLSQMLRSMKRNDSEHDEFLDAIIRNAKRLRRLTENILDVTRIESHLMQLRKEVFNLNEVISKSVEDYRIRVQNHNSNAKLLYRPTGYHNINSGDDFTFVHADKERITQVISNLLDNAIKFTGRDDGPIDITIETKENEENQEEAVVTIKDNGPGIDPEILSKLFSKFASKSFQGTGLGLYLSKKIIEAHGGKVWAENNRDGKGATFYFSLPINNRSYDTA
jgi:signal transduction histidine kinase